MPPQLTEAEKLAAAKELQREFSKGGKSKRYHGETSLPQSRVMSRGLPPKPHPQMHPQPSRPVLTEAEFNPEVFTPHAFTKPSVIAWMQGNDGDQSRGTSVPKLTSVSTTPAGSGTIGTKITTQGQAPQVPKAAPGGLRASMAPVLVSSPVPTTDSTAPVAVPKSINNPGITSKLTSPDDLVELPLHIRFRLMQQGWIPPTNPSKPASILDQENDPLAVVASLPIRAERPSATDVPGLEKDEPASGVREQTMPKTPVDNAASLMLIDFPPQPSGGGTKVLRPTASSFQPTAPKAAVTLAEANPIYPLKPAKGLRASRWAD